jgi:hypothetical protein
MSCLETTQSVFGSPFQFWSFVTKCFVLFTKNQKWYQFQTANYIIPMLLIDMALLIWF